MSEEYVTREELQEHLDRTANEISELRKQFGDLFDGLLEGMPAKDGHPALLGYRELSAIVESGLKTIQWIKYTLGGVLLSVIGAFAFYVIETTVLQDIEEDEAETLHRILEQLEKQNGS